ncbi:MAG: trigger factor [Planctomycetales bacterium]|nr:trigger factor [Planctomycetales bacterium]
MAPSDASPSEAQDPELQADESATGDESTAGDEKQPLSLNVKVDESGACERHVTVTIPREDINRYLDEAYKDLVPKAEIPGFRPGKAPRKLVESRFRDQIRDQVKGSLLLDSMAQVADSSDFSAISEPEIDFKAIELPAEGDMTFEFDIEVRPEFDLPNWKGIKLTRLVHDYSDAEVTERAKQLLRRYGQLAPYEGAAEAGDFVVVNVTFSHEGKTLSRIEEESVEVQPTLSFRDAEFHGFDQLMIGANEGETKTAKITLSEEHEDESLRGQEVDAEFEVLEVKRIELPELNKSFLERFGFDNEEDLKSAVREELERQMAYRRDQDLRQQITGKLLVGADWDLPQDLLKRQSRRELERAVMELQSAGFAVDDIKRYSNQLQRNSMASTRRALKEHFILERIAEEHSIEPTPEDYDAEIDRIAEASDESARRVRARIEKRGQMDALRNQLVERQVLELIQEHAEITDKPYEADDDRSVAIDHAIASRSESAIPEAKYGNEPEGQKLPTDRS